MIDEIAAKRIILVEQGSELEKGYIVQAMAEMTCHLVLLSPFKKVWHEELFEKVLVCNFDDFSCVLSTVNSFVVKHRIDGVIAINEGATALAEDISSMLGLPSISNFSSMSFRFKDRMRVAWECSGIPVPAFRVLYNDSQCTMGSLLHFPIVIKPIANMGSNGVVLVKNAYNLSEAVSSSLSTDLCFSIDGTSYSLNNLYGLPRICIAEEFIEGREYSAEGYVYAGSYHLIGITKKYKTELEKGFDEIAHIFPAFDIEDDDWHVIIDTLDKAHSALGLDYCVTHAEFIINLSGKVIMVELGARIAGDFIPRLVEMSCGISEAEIGIKLCLGMGFEHVSTCRKVNEYFAVVFFPVPESAFNKKLKYWSIPELEPDLQLIECKSLVSPGEIIPKPKVEQRLGYCILRSKTPDALERFICSRCAVEVEYE